jgi:hypothetical protein
MTCPVHDEPSVGTVSCAGTAGPRTGAGRQCGQDGTVTLGRGGNLRFWLLVCDAWRAGTRGDIMVTQWTVRVPPSDGLS